jgi:hypothetical protein
MLTTRLRMDAIPMPLTAVWEKRFQGRSASLKKMTQTIAA